MSLSKHEQRLINLKVASQLLGYIAGTLVATPLFLAWFLWLCTGVFEIDELGERMMFSGWIFFCLWLSLWGFRGLVERWGK